MYQLDILDMSAFVYVGSTSPYFRERSYYGLPVGGIHYAMRGVATSLLQKNDVICAFDGRNNFRKKYPGYKGGRVVNPAVIQQREILFSELSKCGLPCYKLDGYEGDDIISWAVNEHFKNYMEIVIRGNDKDLAHNVREHCRLQSISTDTNSVTEGNFQNVIEKGKSIAFNTISVYKTFCGCSSDKIIPFVSEKGIKGSDLYKMYVSVLEQNEIPFVYGNTSSRLLFNEIISRFPDSILTAKDKQQLNERSEIVWPAVCPEGYSIQPGRLKDIDKTQLALFLSKYNDLDSLRGFKLPRMQPTQVIIDELKEEARNLSSGAFSVDRNLPVNSDAKSVQAETLFLKTF